MSVVKRVYVKKREGFDLEQDELLASFKTLLKCDDLGSLTILDRYDIEGLDDESFQVVCDNVFAEPVQEEIVEDISQFETIVATELLPGQFDSRADAASQCIQLITCQDRPTVRCARLYCFSKELNKQQIEAIIKQLINPVEMRSASLDLPETLSINAASPRPVEVIEGFIDMNEDDLKKIREDFSLSIDIDDVKFAQEYFISEKRDPTITELKVLDTYWSDHCRHTTFNTKLEDIKIENDEVRETFESYLQFREELGRSDKPISLMDIGTIGARVLKERGLLKDLDESDEINACTIKANVDVNGEDEEWLYYFKNETHNHPTQIEPYGGAATCLGGAIRDPLSGRAYVYQSLRLTGAGEVDTTSILDENLASSRLSTKEIMQKSALGFSSYGNQIGLATGLVNEIIDLGYEAKRMEIGAVVGAAPKRNVVRGVPKPGDKVVLVGGKTGRDGIGGATGSSKAHNSSSQETCGSEVQRGNPLEERKLQRLFRDERAASKIIRCNDFGAGGVSVAIGELADGLDIDLNAIPTKYRGLNGTELALSESQERMACVIENENVDEFLELAKSENLIATVVAEVTDNARMKLHFNGQTVVDLSREILDSAGAPKSCDVYVPSEWSGFFVEDFDDSWLGFDELAPYAIGSPNTWSTRGLTNMFDSTIGAGTVMMPMSGKMQLTPSISMVSKLPVLGETHTVSGMSWGYNPDFSTECPYTGAYLAVVDSVAKLIASGFSRKKSYLTFQEYFESLGRDPEKWGKPFSSVLGALQAQIDLSVASIGGKDSMSGSFEDLSVPPTLVSFATALGTAENIISPDFKGSGNVVLLVTPKYEGRRPCLQDLLKIFDTTEDLIKNKKIESCNTCGNSITLSVAIKSAFGNWLGLQLNSDIEGSQLNKVLTGSFLIEVTRDNLEDVVASYGEQYVCEIGLLSSDPTLSGRDGEYDFSYTLSDLKEEWDQAFKDIYRIEADVSDAEMIESHKQSPTYSGPAIVGSKPKVIIPVFPGTNCEYDCARAFNQAGGDCETFIINTLSSESVDESVEQFASKIDESQILMIPGGFSGGDEPGGSAKLIASYMKNPRIAESIMSLVKDRDGLILGICNGFQALMKLGLLQYGEIKTLKSDDATLARNKIGLHQSGIVGTRICSTLSPWFSKFSVGDIFHIPISHGEGRFVCTHETLEQLINNGQVCTQYCDWDGEARGATSVNPNGSVANIEAICSPDGHILGKMGHSERRGKYLYKNVPGNHNQEIFEAGIEYFKI